MKLSVFMQFFTLRYQVVHGACAFLSLLSALPVPSLPHAAGRTVCAFIQCMIKCCCLCCHCLH